MTENTAPEFHTRIVEVDDEPLEDILGNDAVKPKLKIPLSPLEERKPKPIKEYKFNLIQLESDLDGAYKAFKKFESEETRTLLFTTIRDLAFAILTVGSYPKKSSINIKDTAYEYGIYLFGRLATGSFTPETSPKYIDKMPWQAYIDINLNHIIFSKKDNNEAWIDLVEDLEFLVDATRTDDTPDQSELYSQRMVKDSVSRDLQAALQIHFSDQEIERLLPLSVDLIFSNPKYFINDKMPKDIKDFSLVLIALAKRIATKNNLDDSTRIKKTELTKMLSSSVRSTVFLSSVVNSNFFPKELLLSLDTDSLFRLCQISGGKRIRIPTQRELNTLVGAVVTVSKMVIEGKNFKESVNESKKEFDLVFSHQINTETFVAKVIKSISTFGEDEKTDPLISIIVMSIKSLEKLFDKVLEKSENADPETVLRTYEVLSKSLSSFTHIMNELSKNINKSKNP